MHEIMLFGFVIPTWFYAPIAYCAWVIVLLTIKKIVFVRLEKFASRTSSKLDDILLGALNTPLALLILVSGSFILKAAVPTEHAANITTYLVIAFKATTILAVVLFIDRLIRNIFRTYSHKVDILKTSGGVAQGVVRVLVLGIGLLVLLDSFGVSITPILASLGIGSLAVALALQPTLENFFSGVQIIADKPIQVGQFIKLESGEEGYVDKIGWRSTWIRLLPNNMVIVPNKVLVSSRVLNYYYPQQEMAVLVNVGVHYESDLERVEKVTIEVGEEVMKTVSGGVPEFKPFIRYHTFNDFSIDFTVILRAKEFVDNYLIKHEFIKRLHKRYAKEGFVIPYPIRAINYSQEKAFEKK